MKIKCLVVDHDPQTCELICRHLKKFEVFDVVKRCRGDADTQQVLDNFPIDLMILDTQLANTNGIDFLQSLVNPPKVIVTSLTRDYAVESFDLGVVDYLLKPFTFGRFKRAIDKYLQLSNISAAGIQLEHRHLLVRENKRIVKVYLNDILYIEGLGEYVKIHTENKSIVTKNRMSQIEEKLPSDYFLRIHKSFIISLARIEAYTAQSVEIGAKELPIGRSFKDAALGVISSGDNVFSL